jgi:hypothetical protein
MPPSKITSAMRHRTEIRKSGRDPISTRRESCAMSTRFAVSLDDCEANADVGTNAATASPGVLNEMRAVEVRGTYRGVVTSARILAFPDTCRRHATGTKILVAGVAMVLGSLALFIASAFSVGDERHAYERWRTAGNPPKTFHGRREVPRTMRWC